MPALFLRDATRSDMAEAFQCYEGRRVGLGYEFTHAVRSTLELIENIAAVIRVVGRNAADLMVVCEA